MQIIKRLLATLGGALLFAAFMWGLLAAPGFLSDRDSIVANTVLREAGR